MDHLQRIDATLAPFGGRFIVHGGEVEVMEGSARYLIVIEFPDGGQARAWYNSGAYQEIVALRTDNSESDVIMADGVDIGHKATDVPATERLNGISGAPRVTRPTRARSGPAGPGRSARGSP